jgi:hypothetical protein
MSDHERFTQLIQLLKQISSLVCARSMYPADALSTNRLLNLLIAKAEKLT